MNLELPIGMVLAFRKTKKKWPESEAECTKDNQGRDEERGRVKQNLQKITRDEMRGRERGVGG